MASDVNVVINLAKAVTGVGFGYPLIFQGKATTAIAYTECASIQDVITAVGENYATNPIYKAALLMLMQNTPPSKFAIMASTDTTVAALPAILYQGWRQLIVVSVGTEEESTAAQISAYIETTDDKMYFTSVETVAGATISGNDRTVMLVHDDPVETVVFPEAALVGATAGKPAGSFTYKNQILNGLTPLVLSEAELAAIEAAHAMAFVLKAGDGVTSDGKNTADEYIDIVDSTDYIVQSITYRTQQLLNQADKIPYDNSGIARLENVCVNVLKEAANNGIIALTEAGVPDYSVSYAPRSDTSATDRAARRYTKGTFTFALAGAVHTVQVTGTIEI